MVDFTGYDGFKISSNKMLEVFEAVYDFARQGQEIIMFGPSGAGKEFLARYYSEHYLTASGRKGEFISVNCSHLVRETTQSTLFGHKRGSFTGAHRDQDGQFELAKDGVLFLDEIGDLDKSVQTMVNRAMDEKTREAMKFGGKKPYTTKNVKVICATERPKEKLNISLLYRSGLQIYVPGLDERDEDVEEAIKYFCLKAIDKRIDTNYLLSKLLNRKEKEIDDNSINDSDIKDLIQEIANRLGYKVTERDWPGNFRALRAAVDSGIIRAKRLNSPEVFIKDVEKYFLHHLGDYSIAGKEDLLPSALATTTATGTGISKWMGVLNHQVPDLADKEKSRLSQFLSKFEDIVFNRQTFEGYMNLSTRNAQLHIKDLKNKKILEDATGKRYRYRVCKKLRESGRPGINPALFMELPGPVNEDSYPEKNLEAQGIIENSRGVFVSDDDSEKRQSFLGALGNKLQENYDVIYFSFQKQSLDDFISACIEHLKKLDIDGWYRNKADDKLELREKISGLAGYFIQSLSQHRKTVIILEGLEVFNTGESQALIEQMIYYWYPAKFVLGSTKQFFHQHFSNSADLSELKLPI